MIKFQILILSFCLILLFNYAYSVLPLVIWHGIGMKCCTDERLNHFLRIYKRMTDGGLAYSVMIGANEAEDVINSLTMPMKEQVERVCQMLRAAPALRDGYNAVGLSQGSLLFRGVAETCPDPPIRNLVLCCGPNAGVFGVPFCNHSYPKHRCDLLARVVSHYAYEEQDGLPIQRFACPAQYWRDPFNLTAYKAQSSYLALVNNERDPHPEYKTNFEKVKRLVLVKSLRDEFVVPAESQWFGFFKENSNSEKYDFNESPEYKENWFGLQTLDKRDAVALEEVDGGHCEYSDEFYEYMIKTYLMEE